MTIASKAQRAEVDRLSEAYKEIVDAQGESTDEAVKARYALDEATASYEENKQTIRDLNNALEENIEKVNQAGRSLSRKHRRC